MAVSKDRRPGGDDEDQAGRLAAADAALGTAPIEAAQPGDIIVIDNGGKLEFSCWGGLLALSAKLKGVSGVVIDGASRDIDEARELEFPVYARGVVPMTARNRVVQESYNQEIQFAGVQCRPGDLVLADGSGIIIIPKEKEEEVVSRRRGDLRQGTRDGGRHPQRLFRFGNVGEARLRADAQQEVSAKI